MSSKRCALDKPSLFIDLQSFYWLIIATHLFRTYFIRPPQLVWPLVSSARWQLDDDITGINISFDDGPDPRSTPALLRLLDDNDLKATFFLSGRKGEEYSYLVEEIRSAGHQIGSHGYHHLSGWTTSPNQYVDNTIKASDLLCTRLFRPPYGRISMRQNKMLQRQVDIIMWSLMPGDFKHVKHPGRNAKVLLDRVKVRDIIALHDHAGLIRVHQEVLPRLKEVMIQHKWSSELLPE